jgi:hypothetical protein
MGVVWAVVELIACDICLAGNAVLIIESIAAMLEDVRVAKSLRAIHKEDVVVAVFCIIGALCGLAAEYVVLENLLH